jgi:hypothetical protein
VTALVARPGSADRRGRSIVAVEAEGRRVGWVEVTRDHRQAHVTVAAPADDPTDPTDAPTGPAADPLAWSTDAADRSARARWRDRHPAIRTVWRLEVDAGCGASPSEVLEAVGDLLVDRGVRRLDVRIAADHPVAPRLAGDRWVQGRVGDDIIASLAVAYPWTDEPDPHSRLARAIRPLPPRARRVVRRVAAIHPRQIPELVRSVGTEAVAAVRHRYAPGTRSLPVEGAPAGSHPFAASRYRTVRAAFDLVPPTLRATSFLDVGCGDGRVLREALDAGFAHVIGRELDPELADRARALVGAAGDVDAGDALASPLSDDVGVAFLNNPFDGPLVARFADLLADSLRRRPRPLLVLYLNPRPIDPLLAAGLVLVHVDPRFSILATEAAP